MSLLICINPNVSLFVFIFYVLYVYMFVTYTLLLVTDGFLLSIFMLLYVFVLFVFRFLYAFFVFFVFVFFFFKQKTAYEMRISDWSSDVCSSDLPLSGSTACGRSDSTDTATRPAANTAQPTVLAKRSMPSAESSCPSCSNDPARPTILPFNARIPDHAALIPAALRAGPSAVEHKQDQMRAHQQHGGQKSIFHVFFSPVEGGRMPSQHRGRIGADSPKGVVGRAVIHPIPKGIATRGSVEGSGLGKLRDAGRTGCRDAQHDILGEGRMVQRYRLRDRKSTRLNSSH